MQMWMQTALRIIQLVIGYRNRAMATIAVALLGLVTLLLVMKAVTRASGGCDTGWTRRMVAMCSLLIIVVGAEVVTVLHVLPYIASPVADKLALAAIPLAAIPLAALLGVATPLMAYIMRTRYAVTLSSTLLSLLSGFLMILAANAVVDSLEGGNRGFFAVRKRTETLDRFMQHN